MSTDPNHDADPADSVGGDVHRGVNDSACQPDQVEKVEQVRDGAETPGPRLAAVVRRARPVFRPGSVIDAVTAKQLDALVDSMKVGAFEHLRRATELPGIYTAGSFANLDRLIRASPAFNPTLNFALRVSDALTPSVLTTMQRSLTADLAAVFAGPSAVTGWRAALASQTALADIAAAFRTPGLNAPLTEMFAHLDTARLLSQVAVHNLDTLTPWADIATKLATPPLSAAPLSAFRGYLRSIADDPDEHALTMTAVSSFALGGTTASQVLLAKEDEDHGQLLVVGKVTEQAEDELVAPWRAGHLAVAQEVRDRLALHDATVPEMLDGAWLEIERPGPGQLVKVCACAVEALDRALRAVGPDERVRAWIAATGLKPSKTLVIFSDKGALTRQARIRYATRSRLGDRKLIETQERSMSALVGELTARFNAGKHASKGDITQARVLLLTTEALLGQLLIGSE